MLIDVDDNFMIGIEGSTPVYIKTSSVIPLKGADGIGAKVGVFARNGAFVGSFVGSGAIVALDVGSGRGATTGAAVVIIDGVGSIGGNV